MAVAPAEAAEIEVAPAEIAPAEAAEIEVAPAETAPSPPATAQPPATPQARPAPIELQPPVVVPSLPTLEAAASVAPAEPPLVLPQPSGNGEHPRHAAWRIVAPEAASGSGPGAQPSATAPELAAGGHADRMSGIAPATASVAQTSATASAPQAPRAQQATGARACVGCGLSLSANARFCRRCGTRQG